MAPYSTSASALLLQHMLLANRKRKEMFHKVILLIQAMKVGMLVLLICILAFAGAGGLGLGLGLRERSRRKIRSLSRNTDWWNKVPQDYSDQRFKKIFQVSKGTFKYVLETIKNDISKETVTEEPISPEKRLSICLLPLGRGDYNHTISELVGVGESTVCNVTEEDLELDHIGNHRRPTDKVRELLVMVQGNNQQRGPGAERVREAIKIKLWNEKETKIVT
eukprot:gene14835-16374_t